MQNQKTKKMNKENKIIKKSDTLDDRPCRATVRKKSGSSLTTLQ